MCGEESGIEFIRHIAMVTGDDMEVRKYKRLTSLTVLNKAVGKISAVWFVGHFNVRHLMLGAYIAVGLSLLLAICRFLVLTLTKVACNLALRTVTEVRLAE